MTKLLVVLLVAAGLLAFGGSALLERVSEARSNLPDVLDRPQRDQSSAQLSAAEFLRLPKGSPQSVVQATVGEPDGKHHVSIERLELDCWYYGIAGATGAYQLCFVDGKLRAKVGFGAEL
jgi:hypothetical protein